MSASASSQAALSRVLETRFSVVRAVPAGRAALGLAAVLKCWRGRRETCRVALPGAVCHEVLLAVLAANCEPVFCDVDVTDGLVTQSEWERARLLGAEVALVVHLYGNAARMNHVRALFPAPNCLVVDDAAQALGSFSQDGLAGGKGDVGLLSFGRSKHIELGNAAILFRDSEFANEVLALLRAVAPVAAQRRNDLTAAFRARLDVARSRLRSDGDAASSGFSGLLEGMEPVLDVAAASDVDELLVEALDRYPQTARSRIAKAQLWMSGLKETTFEPVGMGPGCVPWRYTCRLPGISWSTQHDLAQSLRTSGMHVSNWYLPAHWYLGHGAGALPGVETLAREIFQFWVDESTAEGAIRSHVAAVRRETTRFVELERRVNS